MQMITPIAMTSIGYQYWIVYTVLCFAFPVTVFFFYPETMGQSLEKLEELFQQDLSIFQTVRLANKLAGTTQELDEMVSDKGKKLEQSGDTSPAP